MRNTALALSLLRAGCKGELTTTAFKLDVAPLLAHVASPGELRKAEQHAREALVNAGWAKRPPRARSRLSLTALGRAQTASILGLGKWSAKLPTWGKLVRPALIARALDLQPVNLSTLNSVEFLRREILRQLCGERGRVTRLSPDQRARAAAAVGAIRGDKMDLELKLMERGAATLNVAEPHDANLEDFATEVLRVARNMPIGKGRIGPSLVFVNHAWKAFRKAHPESRIDLPEFKERLRDAWLAEKMPLAIGNILEPQWKRDVVESRIDDPRGHYWNMIDLSAA